MSMVTAKPFMAPALALWPILRVLPFITLFAGLPFASPAADSNSAYGPMLQILDPRSDTNSTGAPAIHVLGRTSLGTKVTVAGEPALVLPTGIFVRDQVPLTNGENRIEIVATDRNGRRAERKLIIRRQTEPAPGRQAKAAAEIRPDSVEPAQDILLTGADTFDLSFRGIPGWYAEYRLGGFDWTPMAEIQPGLYRTTLPGAALTNAVPTRANFRLLQPTGDNAAQAVEAQAKGRIGLWDETILRIARVKEDGVALSYGLHEVRLGGPYVAEVPSGTLLRVTGVHGANYRVRLSSELDAWISSRGVEWSPPGTPVPHLAFNDISVSGDASYDYVTIPYTSPVPFSITPCVNPGGRALIEIDFFGAHHAATWISHRPTGKTIREVTVKQIATDHLRVCVELEGAQIWGYQSSITNNTFRLTIRRRPKLAPALASGLKGLTIALEPGHGGSNSGARGVSGTEEKEINRMAVESLAEQFRQKGAQVVIVREEDQEPSLAERTRRAIQSNADLFVSVHANSAGHDRGYLRTSGTSTYYKWPFSRDFAEAVHARLLVNTGLNDFGNVGNFNYYPIRMNTWMPAILVEQAFMSNPEDEAKMLDRQFRKQMMQAVVLGTEDWLKSSLSSP